MIQKLNNCPLCESHYVGTFYLDGKYFVSCEDCDIRTQSYDTEDEAKIAWNRLPAHKSLHYGCVLELQFHKIHPDVVLPEAHNGVCYDLTIPEDIVFDGKFLEHKMVPLGFSCKIPEGYHAKIYLRSSSPGKYGILLANSVGIIDSSYCGDNDEWKLTVLHFRPQKEVIPAGTRIAQFEIIRNAPKSEFKLVDSLGMPDRGGFGSTGK